MTIEDLTLCSVLAREAEDATERVQRLRAMMERTTTTIKDTPGGGSATDKMADAFAKLDEWERDAKYRAEAYLDHAWIVKQAINGLPDDRQRKLLTLKYVDGLPWGEVVEKMQYSDRQCYRFLAAGLEALGITPPEEYCQ